MTVAELIADLQKLPQDAVVRLYTDHGQMSMKASTITIQHMTAEHAVSWACYADEHEAPSKSRPCNVVEIGAP